MIRVSVRSNTGELARINIDNIRQKTRDEADYVIEFAVDTGEGFAMYQRSVENFPRKRYNALGLLRIALSTLDEKELTLDGDIDQRNENPRPHSSDLVRVFGRWLGK